jgi:hypothetical protein
MRNIEKRLEKLEQQSGKDLLRCVTFKVKGADGKVIKEFKVPINYRG